jgi:hypothetical protein
MHSGGIAPQPYCNSGRQRLREFREKGFALGGASLLGFSGDASLLGGEDIEAVLFRAPRRPKARDAA